MPQRQNPPPDNHRAVTIYLSPVDCELLACLDEQRQNRYRHPDGLNHSVSDVLQRLADHAVTGVYRPGCWERPWIEQVFPDFQRELEPGDPYGRRDEFAELFQRPRQMIGRRPPPTLEAPVDAWLDDRTKAALSRHADPGPESHQ